MAASVRPGRNKTEVFLIMICPKPKDRKAAFVRKGKAR